jgi:translation initiation factor 4G
MPSFPNPAGGKDITFKFILLAVCQDEFESMPKSLNPSKEEIATVDPEELNFKMSQQRARFLANMKFIGNLVLELLLSTRIVANIMVELVGTGVPEEHVLECVCELLTGIGSTMEAMPAAKNSVESVCTRLHELKQCKRSDGKALLSKRIHFSIQDVLDMRAAGWTKKTFKAAAKTKEEIRLEQEKDIAATGSGKGAGATYINAGARNTLTQKESQSKNEWRDMKTVRDRR